MFSYILLQYYRRKPMCDLSILASDLRVVVYHGDPVLREAVQHGHVDLGVDAVAPQGAGARRVQAQGAPERLGKVVALQV